MTAPALEVLAPIRTAILGVAAITTELGTFAGAASIHTRRPVPVEATFPMLVIGPLITRTDEDGINDWRPIVVVDITVYGEQPNHYRDVEAVADAIYAMFHRQPRSLAVDNYSVTQIRCSGPSPALAASSGDEESRVGRRVTLTIQLYAKS